MKTPYNSFLSALTVALVLGTGTHTWAQTLSISTVSDTPADGVVDTFDMQGNGPTDWVQFGTDGSGSGFNLTTQKSGGSVDGVDTIGAISENNDPFGGGLAQNTAPIFLQYPGSNTPVGLASGNWSVQTAYGIFNGVPAANGACFRSPLISTRRSAMAPSRWRPTPFPWPMPCSRRP